MFDWSIKKCLAVGACWVAGILAFIVPITIGSMHYNDTERDRANVCAKQGAQYIDGSCAWGTRGSLK